MPKKRADRHWQDRVARETWVSSRSAPYSLDQRAYSRRQQLVVGSLFSSPQSVLASNTVGIAVILYTYHISGQNGFLALASLSALILFGRIRTFIRYGSKLHDEDTVAQTFRWNLEFQIGASLFAFVQGLSCFIAFRGTNHDAAQLINTIAVISFASGYVARNAARPVFVIAQLLVLCIPLALGLALSVREHYSELTIFLFLYAVTNIVIVRSIGRTIRALADANVEAASQAGVAQKNALQADMAMKAMSQGLALFNKDLELELQNPRSVELYGIGRTMVNCTMRQFLDLSIAGRALSFLNANVLIREATATLHDKQSRSLEFVTPLGASYFLTLSPSDEQGVLLITEDVTKERAIGRQIEAMAREDRLTRLANRNELDKVLETLSWRNGCEQEERAAVLYVDLDHFKDINDTLGHATGDEVLKAIALRIRKTTRAQDTVARFGGDEFVIIMRDVPCEEALDVAARIVATVEVPVHIDDRTLSISASIGVAVGPDHGLTGSHLLSAADLAVYEAKSGGRNRVALFDASLEAAFRRRAELEVELRQAIVRGQLSLAYQPIVDISGGRMRMVEALLRWNHPERGQISPGEFIPIAERSEMIELLGEWALERACHEISRLDSTVNVSINVSPNQFRNPARLFGAVESALASSGIEGHRVQLEITESVLLGDREATLALMRRLKMLGISFALDDFGTGFASIGYLATYPFEKVKIDQSFINSIDTDESLRSITETVQYLATRMKFEVVAEGIETPTQLEAVREIGIPFGQGYYFGKPQKASDLLGGNRNRTFTSPDNASTSPSDWGPVKSTAEAREESRPLKALAHQKVS